MMWKTTPILRVLVLLALLRGGQGMVEYSTRILPVAIGLILPALIREIYLGTLIEYYK
jgi:hypothetical protein